MRPTVKILPRNLIFAGWLVITVSLLVAAACGGGDDDDNGQTGQLTDPQNVPTATTWQQPPDVVLLDPNNLPTLPPQQPNGPTPTPVPTAGEPGVCGDTYTVVAGDTTFGIAEKCGVSADDIIAANPDIDPRSLSVGQVLILPEPPAEATATP
jgi:hypothetical protein